MTLFLDLRAHPVGGGVAPEVSVWDGGRLVQAETLPGLVAGREVVLATHGFNVDESSGETKLAWFEALLALDGKLYFAVLWPGDAVLPLGFDYPMEGGEAVASAKLLAGFLDTFFRGATGVSFVSHSLGARLVLETIRRTSCTVKRAVLMAGAIDDTCLADEYNDAACKLESISLLASRSDRVLEWLFPAGNLVSGLLSRGDPYWHGALGRYGPNGTPLKPVSIKPDGPIPDDWAFGHHNYLPSEGGLAAQAPPVVAVPAQGTPAPAGFPATTACWAASFVASRLG